MGKIKSVPNVAISKTTHGCTCQGFTLVELLVVITIIAILAGTSIPALKTVFQYMHRTKARAQMMQIRNAVCSYQTEYGCLPVPSGTMVDWQVKEIGEWEPLIIALNGNRRPSAPSVESIGGNISNARGIRFLEIDKKDLVKGAEAFQDPTFSIVTPATYIMKLDSDYDDLIVLDDLGGEKISGNIAIFSKNGLSAVDKTKVLKTW